MIWGIGWFLCGLIAMGIGQRKGEGLMGLFVGWLLGPLGILIALISTGNRIPCPFCKEPVNKEASICPHCRQELTSATDLKTKAGAKFPLGATIIGGLVFILLIGPLMGAFSGNESKSSDIKPVAAQAPVHEYAAISKDQSNQAANLHSGECLNTKILAIGYRLEGTPGSGTSITYANGIEGASWQDERSIFASRPGDPIRLCLVDIERNCKPGTEGRTYSASNLKNGGHWTLPDSFRMCKGMEQDTASAADIENLKRQDESPDAAVAQHAPATPDSDVDQNLRECLLPKAQYGQYSSYDGGKSAMQLMMDCESESAAWIAACVRRGDDKGNCNVKVGIMAQVAIKSFGK